MEIRFIFIAMLASISLYLTGGAPAVAQTNIDSLRELMREQATERAEQGRTGDLEVFITEEAERQVAEARRRGETGNVQIRRGNTSGVEQEQVGEGNYQSINVGAGN